MRKRPLLLHRIKSSTLVEVVVAMLISTIVFFFTLTIMINILGGTNLLRKYYKDIAMHAILNEPILKDQGNTTYEVNGLTFNKTITPYNNDGALLLITVEIKDGIGNTTDVVHSIMKNPITQEVIRAK